MLMGGNSGGGGRGGRSGGGGGGGSGDAGQPGEVVRAANAQTEKARLGTIIKKNVDTLKQRESGIAAMDKELSKIESAGQFNHGKRDHATWKALNEASIKATRDQSILKARTKNILARYKRL